MADKKIADEVILLLKKFAQTYNVDTLFIVGGYCRSVLTDFFDDLTDIDVLSAYPEQALHLGSLFASEVLNVVPVFRKEYGTTSMEYASNQGKIRIEFQGNSISSYMQNQEIKDWISINRIDNTPLMNNIYGRDFTINTLLFSLKNGHLYDPTNRAINDFEMKNISSVLPPNILLKYNPSAILKAIRLALQYDFDIDPNLRRAMLSNVDSLPKYLSTERILKEIVRILKVNGPKGLDMLKKYTLDKCLLEPSIKQYLGY